MLLIMTKDFLFQKKYPDKSLRECPCGNWPSPITLSLVSGKTLAFSDIASDGYSVFWLERRPHENGRTALMQWSETEGVFEVTPQWADVGTRVHEYGGGSYAVDTRGVVYSEKSTGAIWYLRKGFPASLIAEGEGMRYADLRLDPYSEMVLAVREEHFSSAKSQREPKAALVVLGSEACAGHVIREGADFYMAPALSPRGDQLVWIEWDHPSMPWDATRLCCAYVRRNQNGQILGLEGYRVLAGGEGNESLSEPRWTDRGRLLVISDRGGQWRVWEVLIGKHSVTLHPYRENAVKGEIGQPAWVFGQRSYTPLPQGECLFLSVNEGKTSCVISTEAGEIIPFFGRPDQSPVPLVDGRFAWIESCFEALPSIKIGDAYTTQILRSSAQITLSQADISCPDSVWFPVGDGLYGHAFFYPPANAQVCVPKNERPPMIVWVHGGPTARAQEALSLKIQWWTSRGFAVLEVNYGGSTGFGRAWRERLKGQWGVVDVADCIAACQYLCHTGRVDPKRIAIRGTSAGGMTVLLALAESDLFAAGVSLYGVTDLYALAMETHKFESHYLEGLIGPLPDSEALYRARSPQNVVARIRAPVLLLHGMEDRIVPPEQARQLARALQKSGTYCVLQEFPDEGHGFRRESTIRAAFEAELRFYGTVFGFTPSMTT